MPITVQKISSCKLGQELQMLQPKILLSDMVMEPLANFHQEKQSLSLKDKIPRAEVRYFRLDQTRPN